MSLSLQFSLDGMEGLYDEAVGYKNNFKKAMDDLDAAVKELGQYWTSDETGTYQQFQSLYNEKKNLLISAYDYMEKFCAKIESKKNDFKAAADSVNRKAA